MGIAVAINTDKPVIEYSITSGKCSTLPLKSELMGDNSITNFQKKYSFKTSREQLNESITVPSRMTFIQNNLLEIHKIFRELKFNNPSILESSFYILEKCAQSSKTDIKSGKTSQGEILIYRKRGGNYTNLLIDEEGDISFLKFGKTQNDKKVEFFSSESKLDYNKIVSLL